MSTEPLQLSTEMSTGIWSVDIFKINNAARSKRELASELDLGRSVDGTAPTEGRGGNPGNQVPPELDLRNWIFELSRTALTGGNGALRGCLGRLQTMNAPNAGGLGIRRGCQPLLNASLKCSAIPATVQCGPKCGPRPKST